MFGCCFSVRLHLSMVTNTFCLLDANCVKSQLEISAHGVTQFSRESNSYPESSAAFLPHHTLSKELGLQLNFWPFCRPGSDKAHRLKGKKKGFLCKVRWTVNGFCLLPKNCNPCLWAAYADQELAQRKTLFLIAYRVRHDTTVHFTMSIVLEHFTWIRNAFSYTVAKIINFVIILVK